MKKLKILSLLLLLIIINTCTTTKEIISIQYILPPVPERKEIILPDKPTIKDYADIINYYDELVKEWEEWGTIVKKIIK